MKYLETDVHQARVVKIDRLTDERGFFARTYCRQEFAEVGLPVAWPQSSISFNIRRGTLRGLHFQWPPSQEGKLIRCLRGSVLDVLLDLRPDSPSYLKHTSVELDEEGRDAVYVPNGVAHGFLTLTDATEILYQMTDTYAPDLATGVRWDDPAFGILWPIRGRVIMSERDAKYPDFDRRGFEKEFALRSVPVK